MKLPNNKLTVIFRDDSPMVMCNSSPTYRSVQVTLTDEQVHLLARRETYSSGTVQYYEEIAPCFIEPDAVSLD